MFFMGRRSFFWAFQGASALAISLFSFTHVGNGGTDEFGFLNFTKQDDQWVEQTLKRLTLEEKVGQMLQIRFYVTDGGPSNPHYRYIREALQKYKIGSLLLGMRFDKSGPVRGSAAQAAKISNELQRESRVPLLLAADLERGVASRLREVPDFPWPMAFGAADDTEEVERFAAVTAQEARAVGIYWLLSPVADVNSNPANPVINTRSFGEDSGQVRALVAAYVRGAHENGVLVTAKHFPGNGDTIIDAHRGIASIDSDLVHLQQVEFLPFKSAIIAGVDSIMLAHARIPALEPDPDKITTISSRVVYQTLKKELGFKGVVLTDALEMQGLTKVYDPRQGSPTARAAVDAIKAGCDVIMLPTDLDGAFHAILQAVRSGEIAESRIDESVRKILEMKAAVGLDKTRFVDVDEARQLTSRPEDMSFAQTVADEAVTLVRNNKQILPLPDGSHDAVTRAKSLVVVVLGEALTGTDGREFEKAVKVRRPDADVFYFDNRTQDSVRPEILTAVKAAEQVIMAVYVAHNGVRHIVAEGKLLSSFGPLGPSGHLLEDILGLATAKTVVVDLGSPYLIVNYPEIQTYICTYAQPPTSEISAVKALFGEIQNHAKLPVTLPGIAPRGFSLPWPREERANSVAPSVKY